MKKYKEIIDDWSEFKQESEREKAKVTIRRNNIKASGNFEQKLSQEFVYEQAEWNKDIYRLEDTESPGKTMLHWRGEYYVQEESATIPVEILNPEKGDRILDMCAAPGGKTTQIADKINNQGLVIANDDSSNRLQSLHANVYRTGSFSVSVTNYDGRHMPEAQKFDKILVDAPCTGEGDKFRRNFKTANERESKNLSTLQKQLLKKANKLVKPGGTIVYSTCTITPEENEKVVDEVLKDTKLTLDEVNRDFPHQKGIRGFEQDKFSSEVEKTVRILPHHLNSGVIYVAKFNKPEN